MTSQQQSPPKIDSEGTAVSVKRVASGDDEGSRQPELTATLSQPEQPPDQTPYLQPTSDLPIMTTPHRPFGSLASLPKPQYGRISDHTDASLSEDIGHVDESEMMQLLARGPLSPPELTRIAEAPEEAAPVSMDTLAVPASDVPIHPATPGQSVGDTFATPAVSLASSTQPSQMLTPPPMSPEPQAQPAQTSAREPPTRLILPPDEGESLAAVVETEEEVPSQDVERKSHHHAMHHSPRSHVRTPRSRGLDATGSPITFAAHSPSAAKRPQHPRISTPSSVGPSTTESHATRHMRIAAGRSSRSLPHAPHAPLPSAIPSTPHSVSSVYAPLPSPMPSTASRSSRAVRSRSGEGDEGEIATSKVYFSEPNNGVEGQPPALAHAQSTPPVQGVVRPQVSRSSSFAPEMAKSKDHLSVETDDRSEEPQLLSAQVTPLTLSVDERIPNVTLGDDTHTSKAAAVAQPVAGERDEKTQEARDAGERHVVDQAATESAVDKTASAAVTKQNGRQPADGDAEHVGASTPSPPSPCHVSSGSTSPCLRNAALAQLHRALPVLPVMTSEEQAARYAERAEALEHDSDEDSSNGDAAAALTSPMQSIHKRGGVVVRKPEPQPTPVSSAQSGFGVSVHTGWFSAADENQRAIQELAAVAERENQRNNPGLSDGKDSGVQPDLALQQPALPHAASSSSVVAERPPERGRIGWRGRRGASAGMGRADEDKSQSGADRTAEGHTAAQRRSKAPIGPASLPSSPAPLSPSSSDHEGSVETAHVPSAPVRPALALSDTHVSPHADAAYITPKPDPEQPPQLPPRTPRSRRPISVPRISTIPPGIARAATDWLMDPETLMPLAPPTLTGNGHANDLAQRDAALYPVIERVQGKVAEIARAPVMSELTASVKSQGTTETAPLAPTVLSRAVSGEANTELLRINSHMKSPRMGKSERITHVEAEEDRGKRDYEERMEKIKKKVAKKERKLQKLFDEQAEIAAAAKGAESEMSRRNTPASSRAGLATIRERVEEERPSTQSDNVADRGVVPATALAAPAVDDAQLKETPLHEIEPNMSLLLPAASGGVVMVEDHTPEPERESDKGGKKKKSKKDKANEKEKKSKKKEKKESKKAKRKKEEEEAQAGGGATSATRPPAAKPTEQEAKDADVAESEREETKKKKKHKESAKSTDKDKNKKKSRKDEVKDESEAAGTRQAKAKKEKASVVAAAVPPPSDEGDHTLFQPRQAAISNSNREPVTREV